MTEGEVRTKVREGAEGGFGGWARVGAWEEFIFRCEIQKEKKSQILSYDTDYG